MLHSHEADPTKKVDYSDKAMVVKSAGNQLKITATKAPKFRPTPQQVNPSFPMFSFTPYDKCESLLQFPRVFVACWNSSDADSFTKLLRSRTDRTCEINYFGRMMDPAMFVKAFQLTCELYPDCVTQTLKAVSVGNQVTCSLVFQYTASKTIETSLKKREPEANQLCPSFHTEATRLNNFIASHPVEDRPSVLTSVYTAEELIVQGRTLFTVTFEDCSRKITRLDLECDYSTFEAV